MQIKMFVIKPTDHNSFHAAVLLVLPETKTGLRLLLCFFFFFLLTNMAVVFFMRMFLSSFGKYLA